MHAERDIYCVSKSVRHVRLSMSHSGIVYLKECTYRQTLFPSARGMTLSFFFWRCHRYRIPRELTQRGGVEYTRWEGK